MSVDVLVWSGRRRGVRPLDSTNAHISTAAKLTLSPGGRLAILASPATGRQQVGGGRRAAVQSFSAQSRKRLLQLFAGVDEKAVKQRCVFITLTYPYTWPKDPADWHADLEAMLERFRRKYPNMAIIWRMELQGRGAPHFHLLCFGYRFVPWQWVKQAWWAIAHDGDVNQGERATDVEKIGSWRKGIMYVSKYMSKASTDALPVGCGRLWGCHNEACLPRTLQEYELTEVQFDRLRALMLDWIPYHRFAYDPHLNHTGLWTMLPGYVQASLIGWLHDDWQSKLGFYVRWMGCKCSAGKPGCLLD